MKCLSCKYGNMIDSTTTYMSALKNCVLIIKNVPCMKCTQCGDELFNTDILEKIEKSLLQPKIWLVKCLLLIIQR